MPPSSPAKLRRPPTKRRLIVQTLRHEIVSGVYGPGSKLPPRQELVKRFRASSVTVHEALLGLIHDGFVVTMGRNGTAVTQHPPHLYHYGIGFPSVPTSASWTRYWTAITNEAHAMESAGPRRFRMYHDLSNQPANPGHTALSQDAGAQRLAGIIFVAPPDAYIAGSALMQERAVPLVGLGIDTGWGSMSNVALDYQSMIDAALDDLAERKTKRVACLLNSAAPSSIADRIARGIQARGMLTRSEWFQGIPYSPGHWVSSLVRLMFAGKPDERPDGFFITDDNLLEPATTGVLAAGITAADGLKIVTHTNFPWPTLSHLPCRRVGFDVGNTLQFACQMIDLARGGREVPPMMRQTAMTEEQFVRSRATKDTSR